MALYFKDIKRRSRNKYKPVGRKRSNCNFKNKIIEQAQKLCESKLREIVSGMTVEEVQDDREKFSQIVLDVASKGLDSIGLELKSFTINDIYR